MVNKIAIVLGGANDVWLQLEEAKQLIGREPDFIVATNHAGRDAPFYIDHWCSVHGDLLLKWHAKRVANGGEVGQVWTAKGSWKTDKLDFKRLMYKGGSSGLLAVDVAMTEGATHVILCGVGLTAQASHYDDKSQRPWKEGPRYRPQWTKKDDEWKSRVRSMSGWTRDYLGKVTPEWLQASVL